MTARDSKKRPEQKLKTDMLPPHNMDAEEAVLGSILVDPEYVLTVGQILEPADFYREKNAWVFEEMLKLGDACNHITLAHRLQTAGRLEAVGGNQYLSVLVERLPTSVHAVEYAKIVRDCSFYRQVITMSGKVAEMAYKAEEEPAQMFEALHDMVNELQPNRVTDIVGPEEHAERMFQMLTKRRDKTDEPVKFGWPSLDHFLGGLYPGDFVVIGARPYQGKTELLFETALHNTVKRNPDDESEVVKRVLVASAEMSVEEFDERESAMLGVPIDKLRSGQLEQTQWDKLFNLVGELAKRPMYFLEGRMTIDHIYNRARLLKATEGLDLVIIDYIQLLRDTIVRRGDSATRERVSAISAGMKQLAQELKVPVITASQLNREVEFRKDKMPVLADLRESGSIEQDADVVIMVTRPEVYDPTDQPGVMLLNVAKARQVGRTKTISLMWREHEHQYGELDEFHQEEFGLPESGGWRSE